ncbi:MAG: helix-turn-helix domain-containing protein [Methanothrix sp.]
MLSKTIQAVRKREELAEDVDWKLYKWIENHPGQNIYALAKSLGWSHGKVYSSVKRLEADGLVKVEKVIINGRSASIVTYRRLQEFFASEEIEEMQEPGYFDEVEEILKNAPS